MGGGVGSGSWAAHVFLIFIDCILLLALDIGDKGAVGGG
jgi:hypothetical protein